VNPLLRESKAHVFVETLDAPELSAEDAHHLARVLRIRPSDAITVSDGVGRWAAGRYDGDRVTLDGGVVEEAPPRGSGRRVVCATPKGDRPELVVQKLTELGLDEVAFTTTARTVARWDSRRAATQLARLRRIARESSMQSRRVRLPTVSIVDWADVVRMPSLAFAEPGGDVIDPTIRTIVVGPEGGFSDAERAACARRVSLADTVLRVETAAIAAGVLLMHGASAADTT
jgi:16S rRNA (uracil1498-N3)-methyltransferase